MPAATRTTRRGKVFDGWRGPAYPGEFPSLGYEVAEWIEEWCVVPDRDIAGEPFILTEEMIRFLVWYYRIDPRTGRFVYSYGLLVRPQKWGKGPLTAAMICAEAVGPVLFDGWTAARGEPAGRPWATPWIQVTAYSEEQTDNVWRALKPMIELGPLANVIPDTGETRINLPGGGIIEPVTASSRSRLGQRVTFVPQDETHSWLKANGMHTLGDNQRRNLAGTGGRAVGTTNAWDPAEQSYAQVLYESGREDIYRDFRQGPPVSLRNKQDLRRGLRVAYGDSKWVDLDRIVGMCQELADRDPAQGERFFLNRIVASADVWMPPDGWQARERPDVEARDGDPIALGFDGSVSEDSTALVGCTEAGHWFPIEVWERPEGEAGEDWMVPDEEVDAAVLETLRRYRVVRFYADPPGWQPYLAKWRRRAGRVRNADGKLVDVVAEFWTNQYARMAHALEQAHTAVITGQMSHDGSEVLTRHVLNARTWKKGSPDKPLILIRKERHGSPKKIDAAMAGTLAYAARTHALADGLFVRRKNTMMIGY